MKKIFMYILIALLALSTFEGSAQAASDKKSLKIAIPNDESTINPYTYQTGYPGLELVNLLYDTLFQLDENNIPQPWLVSDYKISEDGLTYEFTLNEGVKWQDGKPLTANDVKFTVDYFIANPKSRFTNPLQNIVNLEVKDDYNFVMTLKTADPNFMVQPLADVPILPAHIWSEITNPNESTNSLGSGPYKLVEYKSDQYYKLEAFDDYFKGKPATDEIIFPVIPDTTAMFTALKAGEIDSITSSLTPEVVKEFESNPNLKVQTGPGFSTSLLQINAEKYPMTEKSFRQAMALAIDPQYLVDTVTLGFAELGSPGFIHPSSPYSNEDLSFKSDPEQAKKLLAGSGFKDTDGDGFIEGQNGEPIALTMLVHSNSPIRIRTAEIISGWLQDVGIKVQVKSLDPDTVVSLVWPEYDVSKGRDYDLSIWGWSSTLQLFPDRLIELFYSNPSLGSINIGAYKSEEFDQLAEKLKNTLNEDERNQIIMDMQAFVAEEFPIITLYYQEIINAYNPSVYGDYVFQQGKGIFNKLSFVPSAQSENNGDSEKEDKEEEGKDGDSTNSNDQENKEEGSQTDEENTGSNTSLWILAFIIIAIAGVIFFIKKKSSQKNTPPV